MPSSEVMAKFKAGKLHSGGPGGPVVSNPKQAIAIKMSEARVEKKHKGVYPEGHAKQPSGLAKGHNPGSAMKSGRVVPHAKNGHALGSAQSGHTPSTRINVAKGGKSKSMKSGQTSTVMGTKGRQSSQNPPHAPSSGIRSDGGVRMTKKGLDILDGAQGPDWKGNFSDYMKELVGSLHGTMYGKH